MYSGVPIRLVIFVSEAPYESRETPKSVSFRSACPRAVLTRTFSGLTSRWTMPAAWTAASPCSSCIQAHRLAGRQSAAGSQVAPQVVALDEFHDDPERVA